MRTGKWQEMKLGSRTALEREKMKLLGGSERLLTCQDDTVKRE